MKVRELMDSLAELDENAEVILQKDAEGNGYSPLYAVDGDAVYLSDSTWSGDVYSTDWTAEDTDMDEDEWAETLKKPRCVVLAPIN
jgi:hypothetical protein